MGRNEQRDGESSKKAGKRSKKQNLAAIAAARALNRKAGGIIITDMEDTEFEIAQTLQELNSTVRRSPRKQPEIPPPPVTHNSNSIPQPNFSTPIPSNPNNFVQSDSSSEEIAQVEKPRKKRGKTMMKVFSLTPNEKADVEFNELGQPIGTNSKFLSSYVGTLAREMIPMTIKDWRMVDKTLKKDLWICLQSRFNVDAIYKDLLLRMIGLRWKEAKSRLVSAIKAASKSPDAPEKILMLKPDNIKNIEDWNTFVKDKLSKEFESISKKYKAMREKNKIPHTMSRMGYARFAQNLIKANTTSDISRDELWCKAHTKKNGEPPNSIVADYIAKINQHSNSQDSQATATSTQNLSSIRMREDGVAKIFGPEQRGRVRGLGLGVAPSQLGAHVSNSKRVCALEQNFKSLQATVQNLTDHIMGDKNEFQNVPNVTETPPAAAANTPQSKRGSDIVNTVSSGGQMKRRKCKILSWQHKVVAEGTIASTDPNTLVHFEKLGPLAWKVWVDVAVDPEALLWRATSEMTTVRDAVSSTVAWHKEFIAYD